MAHSRCISADRDAKRFFPEMVSATGAGRALAFVSCLLFSAAGWTQGPGQPFQVGNDAERLEFHTGALASGDVDNDGDMDVVEAKRNGLNRLYLYDSTTNAFGPPIPIGTPPGQPSSDVQLADVDGDTDLDLIVANDGARNRLHLNDGAGNFGPGVDISSDDDSTLSIAVGDVNGDNFPDLIAGNQFQVNRCYLNDGSGNFSSGTDTNANPGPRNTQKVILADINGDTFPDVVEGNHSGQGNRWYAGDGDCTFADGVSIGNDQDDTWAIAAEDLDGDSDMDVVAGNDAGDSDKVYLNDGAGGFPVVVNLSTNNTRAVAVADMGNGTSGIPDGDLDLVFGYSGDGVQVYYGNGAGVFGAGTEIPNSNQTRDLALADLNNDGATDIVEGSILENVGNRIYFNACTIGACYDTFAADPTDSFNYDSHDSQDVALADLDNDGDLDIVMAKRDATNRVLLNIEGSGTFLEGLPLGDPVDGIASANAVAVGSLDADGLLDIVIANGGEPNRLYRSESSDPGTFSSGSNMGDATDDADVTRAVAIGDLNGDGDLDVVAANSGGVNRIYQNNGFGDFSLSPLGGPEDSRAVAIGDLDGINGLDIVIGNTGINHVYLNDGTGSFPVQAELSAVDTHSTRAVAIGDLDGDGDLDIVAGNSGNQVNRAYFNDGNGVFTVAADVTSDAVITADIALTDADNDGDLDVVAGNNGRNRLYLNDGMGVFGAGSDIGTNAANTAGVALGDLNGSGSLDLVVANTEPQVDRLHLNGNPTTSGIADVMVPEGAVPTEIELADAFADLEDADTALTYTVELNTNPTLVSTTNPAAGTTLLTLTYQANENGVADLLVRATDTDGLFVEALIAVTVNSENDAPEGTAIANQTAPSGQLFELDVSGNFSDPDGDTLTYSADGLPPSLSMDSGTGIISGTPAAAEAGMYSVTASASDGVLSADEMFELTVTDTGGTNSPPEVAAPISNVTITAGQAYSRDVSGAFSDPDGDTLTYSAVGLPAGLSINSATGVISGTPTSTGVSDVTVTASDGTASVAANFTVTVSSASTGGGSGGGGGGGGSGGANGPMALLGLLLALAFRGSRGRRAMRARR